MTSRYYSSAAQARRERTQAGVLAVGAGLVAAGLLGALVAVHSQQQPAPVVPRPCLIWKSPGVKSFLPSGDAGMVDGHEQVCTDGTWVKVSGYGN